MDEATLNQPDVVAEVSEAFERYERALAGVYGAVLDQEGDDARRDRDLAVLDATFWDSPHTIRYAPNQRGYGFAAIHAHRLAGTPGAGGKDKRIRLEILTVGRDFATVNLEYTIKGRDATGVQSQTWVRFPEIGWKVVSAHVSATAN